MRRRPIQVYDFMSERQLSLYQAAVCYGLSQFFAESSDFVLPLKGPTEILADYGWQEQPLTKNKDQAKRSSAEGARGETQF